MLATVANPELKIAAWYASPHVTGDRPAESRQILGPAGIWWAAAPREHWPTDSEQRARIEAEFDGKCGDRRQEIGFTGQHLEPEQTREILDRCCLGDEEIAAPGRRWTTHFPNDLPRSNEDRSHGR